MTEQERDELIRETYKTSLTVKNFILGTEGQGGCYQRHEKAVADHYSFKRMVLVMMAFSAGGGGAIGATMMKLLSG